MTMILKPVLGQNIEHIQGLSSPNDGTVFKNWTNQSEVES